MDLRSLRQVRDPDSGIDTAIRLLEPLRGQPMGPEAARYWTRLADHLTDFLDAAEEEGLPGSQNGTARPTT